MEMSNFLKERIGHKVYLTKADGSCYGWLFEVDSFGIVFEEYVPKPFFHQRPPGEEKVFIPWIHIHEIR